MVLAVTESTFACAPDTRLVIVDVEHRTFTNGRRLSSTKRFCEDSQGRCQGHYLSTTTFDVPKHVGGYYRDDVAHGLWTDYEGDILVSWGIRACGKRHGAWYSFREDTGELLGINFLEHGTGYWRTWSRGRVRPRGPGGSNGG